MLCRAASERGLHAGAPPAPKIPPIPHTEEVQGKVDPASLPDYVDVGAAEEVMTVEELQDPDWMVKIQDELDALEVRFLAAITYEAWSTPARTAAWQCT